MELKILEFTSDWCSGCKVMEPILKEVCTNLDIKLVEVDVDEDEDLVITYNVRNIPTLVFIKNDEIVDRITGTMSKDKLIERINKL